MKEMYILGIRVGSSSTPENTITLRQEAANRLRQAEDKGIGLKAYSKGLKEGGRRIKQNTEEETNDHTIHRAVSRWLSN